MKSIQLLLVLALSLALISSCKKDDDKEAAPTKTQLLTAKAWKIKAITTNPAVPAGLGIDVDALIEQALGDLSNSDVKFESNGNYVATNRTTGTTTTNKWEFLNNETQLKITSEGEDYTFDIKELTTTTLNLSLPYSVTFGGFPLTITVLINLIPV
ncbi:hypothetical protein GXP67_13320 [Rhodocytophaga rosea]|uniref:Lipocalin-like domain-containing protein n=1 Tax=Rhodocytophaga rosea TaxID=2704465 RepID=A0A6C0GHW3_9BACT|nr:hypothetical protein [Rhodocytophaga rosea]QHT67537.1 hypothetical protein GXP67_13320 [Rhodocytophaga rosea]